MSSSAPSDRPSPKPFRLDHVADRRTEARLSAEVLGLEGDARLTLGVHVRVVNVSRGGALLESGEWLRPGTRTELRLARPVDGAEHPQLLAATGTIMRCWVYRLSPLRYRTALVFIPGRSLPGGQDTPTAAVVEERPRERTA
jgi:hypothetical protein